MSSSSSASLPSGYLARTSAHHSAGVSDKLAYRIPEAVAATGIGRSTLYELIKEGAIKTKKLGASTLIPRAELEKLIDGLPSG